MARRTILLSEINLTEESVNLDISGNLTVTGTSTFTGVSSFGDGTAAAPSLTFSGDSDTGFYRTGNNQIGVAIGGSNRGLLTASGFNYGSGGALTWSDNVDPAAGNADVFLVRDAAAILALKNAANAQTVRVYGDATAATLKYMNLTHDGTNGLITTSGGTFGFGTHTTSAGTNINGVTGYISIVDSGGTPRRLAVLT